MEDSKVRSTCNWVEAHVGGNLTTNTNCMVLACFFFPFFTFIYLKVQSMKEEKARKAYATIVCKKNSSEHGQTYLSQKLFGINEITVPR